MSHRSPRSQSPRSHYESMRNEECARQKRVFDEIQRQAEEELENAQRVLCEAEGNASRNYSRAKSGSPYRKSPSPGPARPSSANDSRMSSPSFGFMFESAAESFEECPLGNSSPEHFATVEESNLSPGTETADSSQYVTESSWESTYSSLQSARSGFDETPDKLARLFRSDRHKDVSPEETPGSCPERVPLEIPSFGDLSSIKGDSNVYYGENYTEVPGTVTVDRNVGGLAVPTATVILDRNGSPSPAPPGTVVMDRTGGASLAPPNTAIMDRTGGASLAPPNTAIMDRTGAASLAPPGTVLLDRSGGAPLAPPGTVLLDRSGGAPLAPPGTVLLDRNAGPSAAPPNTAIAERNPCPAVAPGTTSPLRDGVVRVFPPTTETRERDAAALYGGAPGLTPLGRRKGIIPRKLLFTAKDPNQTPLDSSSCPESSGSPYLPSSEEGYFESGWVTEDRKPPSASTTQYIRSPLGMKRHVTPRRLFFTEDEGGQSSYESSGSPYSIEEALSYGDEIPLGHGTTYTFHEIERPVPPRTMLASTPLEPRRCRIKEGTFPKSPVAEACKPPSQPQPSTSRNALAVPNVTYGEQAYKTCLDQTSKLEATNASEHNTCPSKTMQSGFTYFNASSCPSSYPSALEPYSLFSTDISAGSDETPGQKLRKIIEKGVHQELEDDLPPELMSCNLRKSSPQESKFPQKPQLNQDQIQLLIQMEAYDIESAQQIASDQKKTYKKPCPKQQKAQMDVKQMVHRHGTQPSTSQACEGEYAPMVDPNPEDITPEVAAAMMFSQEKGIKMESCPADTIRYLFPDDPGQPQVGDKSVSVVDPQSKLKQDMVERSAGVPSDGVSDAAYSKTMKMKGQDAGGRKSYDLDMALSPEKREYVLVAQKPQRFNQIQFRGNLPKWFPGYFSAFPDQPGGIKIVSSPFGLFQKAWLATNPKNIPANDVLVVE